ncbi:MAG: hypothetical protein VYA54_06805 [Bdellovibrionota bacterium]|nr:hypothetical protein [Bdellovibrionota bacterium]
MEKVLVKFEDGFGEIVEVTLDDVIDVEEYNSDLVAYATNPCDPSIT